MGGGVVVPRAQTCAMETGESPGSLPDRLKYSLSIGSVGEGRNRER